MPRRSRPRGTTASRTCDRPPIAGRLLVAALGFAGLPRPSCDGSLWALRTWLDSGGGIVRIAFRAIFVTIS
jgi:hypothetical protein